MAMLLSPGCFRPAPEPAATPAPAPEKQKPGEKPARPYTFREPAKRALLRGVNVPPPPGKNWHVASKDNDGVTFVKDLGQEGASSFMALVSTVYPGASFDQPEEFLAWTRETRKKDTDPKRFRLIRHREALDETPGKFCVRYHLKAEDRGVPVKDEPFLILEVKGYSCLHPGDPGLLVDFRYVLRYPPKKKEKGLSQEGERFLRGITFTPPP